MIDELDAETWVRLLADRDAVVERARSTEPLDEDRISAAVKRCYAHIGQPEPQVVWVDGPTSVLVAGKIIDKLRHQLRDQLRHQLIDQLGNQLIDQLGDQLRDQLVNQLGDRLIHKLGDQLRDQLIDQLGDQLGNKLRHQIGDKLGNKLGDKLGDKLRHQLRHQLVNQLGNKLVNQLGNQIGYKFRGSVCSGWWSSWVWYYQALIGLPGINPMPIDLVRQLDDIATVLECHFWLPLEGVCVLSRQHTALHVDDRGELHNPAGAAWEWADGTQIYALDGIRVPEWAVTAEPGRLLDLTNAEQRRVAIKNYGVAD